MIADRQRALELVARLRPWSDHLSKLAALGPGDFTDWPPEAALRPARRERGESGGVASGVDGEVRLWATIRRGAGSSALEAGPGADQRLAAVEEALGCALATDGPLWRQGDWDAIEVWTEAELCGLHGLHRFARLRPEWAPAVRSRIARAVAWHLEHTQPDNATNRPWAAHVFLLEGLSGSRGDSGRAGAATLYAETLVHNAQAQGHGGEHAIDAVSRWILADAGREIAWIVRALDASPAG
jgi:hypothetical protein